MKTKTKNMVKDILRAFDSLSIMFLVFVSFVNTGATAMVLFYASDVISIYFVLIGNTTITMFLSHMYFKSFENKEVKNGTKK